MSKWWVNYPWRMIQTNLREIDMENIDAKDYVRQLKEFDAVSKNTLIATIDGKGQFFCQKKENSKK